MEFNDSREALKQYTGLVDWTIESVNPTLGELKGLGIETDKEPVYKTSDGKIMLKFWLRMIKEPNLLQNITFFLDKEKSMSKNSKKFFIDGKGNSSYAEKEEDAKYLDQASIFHSNRGIADLYKFIYNWFNLSGEQVVDIDLPTLMQGNVNELKKYIQAAKKRNEEGKVTGVKALLYVNDKGYSNIHAHVLRLSANARVIKSAQEKRWGEYLKGFYTIAFKEVKAEDLITPDVEKIETNEPNNLDTSIDNLPY